MELSYVFNAVKRYVFVVAACVILTTAVGFTRAKPVKFMSRATLSIDPASAGPSGGSVSPDRFVATEVSEMTSQGFAQGVAQRLGTGFTARQVQGSTTVSNRSGTDLVDIVAKTPDAAQAKATVKAYIDVYTARVKAAADSDQQGVIAHYDTSMQSVQQKLDAVNAQIAANPTGKRVPLHLTSEAQSLVAELSQLSSDKVQAQLAGPSISSTQIIEAGTDPIMIAQNHIKAYGPWIFIGLFGGTFLAVLLARLSPFVLDAEEVTEVMGRPVIGQVPKDIESSANRRWTVSSDIAMFLDELCTRVDSCDRSGHGLTVLVAGTEHHARSASLATAMAARFGHWGLDVAFVDADPRGTVLRSRAESPSVSIPEVTGDAEPATANQMRPNRRRFTYVDMSGESEVVALHRNGRAEVLSVLSQRHDIVVVASGPLLEARTAAQLASLVDVVLLVVAVPGQTRRRLEAIAQQLEGRRGSLLIVDDPEGRKSKPEEQQDANAGRTKEDPAPRRAGGKTMAWPVRNGGSG